MSENKEYYRDNLLLKRPGVQYEFDQNQIDEYLRCSKDPIYFIRNYVKIISLDEGLILFDMHEYQEEMVNTFHENRFSIVRIGRQSGKCVCINTNVNVRNKKTGEIKTISIGDFYNEQLQKRVNRNLHNNSESVQQI